MDEDVLNKTYNDFMDKFNAEYDNKEFISELKDINKVVNSIISILKKNHLSHYYYVNYY